MFSSCHTILLTRFHTLFSSCHTINIYRCSLLIKYMYMYGCRQNMDPFWTPRFFPLNTIWIAQFTIQPDTASARAVHAHFRLHVYVLLISLEDSKFPISTSNLLGANILKTFVTQQSPISRHFVFRPAYMHAY